MPLLALFPFLKLISGRLWTWLALSAIAASFLLGFWVSGKFEDAKRYREVNLARAAERDVAHLGNQADRDYLQWQRQRERQVNAKLKALEKRLATATACTVPVPGQWLRESEDVPGTAPDAGNTGSTREEVDTADARDVVLNTERNRLEVHQPNVEQIERIRQWYRELRERYNK